MKKIFNSKVSFLKRSISCLLFIVLFATSIFVPAYAEEGTEGVLATPRINDFINGARLSGSSYLMFIPHQNFGDTTISHFNEALYEWNSHLPAGVYGAKRSPTIRHTDTSYPKKDGINRIYRNNTGTTEYVAQTTWWRSESNSSIRTEADINLNMYYPWSNGALSNTYDVWTVFLHEAGHVFGLADTYQSVYSDRVMYGYSSKGRILRSITSPEEYILQQIYK